MEQQIENQYEFSGDKPNRAKQSFFKGTGKDFLKFLLVLVPLIIAAVIVAQLIDYPSVTSFLDDFLGPIFKYFNISLASVADEVMVAGTVVGSGLSALVAVGKNTYTVCCKSQPPQQSAGYTAIPVNDTDQSTRFNISDSTKQILKGVGTGLVSGASWTLCTRYMLLNLLTEIFIDNNPNLTPDQIGDQLAMINNIANGVCAVPGLIGYGMGYNFAGPDKRSLRVHGRTDEKSIKDRLLDPVREPFATVICRNRKVNITINDFEGSTEKTVQNQNETKTPTKD